MRFWKLTLAYDGTPYRGWQVQPGLPTVQGALCDALYRVTGERVLPQGSGRTDAGVHALAQVASFALAAPIPADRLLSALNRCLPPSIRVMLAEPVLPDFHARHSAIGKTYEYRIFPLRWGLSGVDTAPDARDANVPDRICPPTLAPYVWPCRWPIRMERMQAAARDILGTHDFTTFAAADPDLSTREAEPFATTAKTPVRTIDDSHWHQQDGLMVYRVTGSGFLHHMVRNLVGTLVQIGAGHLAADAIPSLIAMRDRAAAGPTAPAAGLFLHHVEYARVPCSAPECETMSRP